MPTRSRAQRALSTSRRSGLHSKTPLKKASSKPTNASRSSATEGSSTSPKTTKAATKTYSTQGPGPVRRSSPSTSPRTNLTSSITESAASDRIIFLGRVSTKNTPTSPLATKIHSLPLSQTNFLRINLITQRRRRSTRTFPSPEILQLILLMILLAV